MFNLGKFISDSIVYKMTSRFTIIFAIVVLLTACSEIDSSIANTPFGMTLIHYEFIIILLSMFAGWTMIIGGITLIVLGLTGEVELIINAVDFNARLVNASPGLILTLIGAYIVLKSRMNFKAHKGNNKDDNSKQFS